MCVVLRRLVLVASVITADVLIGYLAVRAGTITSDICFRSSSATIDGGCFETGRYVEWGPTQVVIFALIALSLVFLGLYLVRGSRPWLVATLVLVAGFVGVPAVMAAPAAFNDSGPVQLPRPT